MEDTNIKELEILAHSLGIELEYSKKIIPIRNFFCASEGHNDYNTLLSLESKELMIRYSKFGVQYFSVTEKGKEVFENWFSLYFLPKKKKRKKKVSAVITMDVQCPYCRTRIMFLVIITMMLMDKSKQETQNMKLLAITVVKNL